MSAVEEKVALAGVQRSIVLASADQVLRVKLRDSLAAMRWKVREANGGAEAMAHLEEQRPEVLLVDRWLPDLEVEEFTEQVRVMFPGLDLLRMDGDSGEGGARSPRRHELFHAVREAQETGKTDGAAWLSAPVAVPSRAVVAPRVKDEAAIEGMIGASAAMRELARLIRLVAPRTTSVLIEGETGSGKEVVARAVHRLGLRANKSFTVLNCAAIPEALLEAELFGHTRGAFTGAVQSRTGRIEAANGGTLFLDEIGEMPLALQAKMLRFLECGELQRVGDNETMRVDVRVIAATHQELEKRAAEGLFRLDLYHRLAVFPLVVPALREHAEDIPALVEFFLAELGKEFPRKKISGAAMEKLRSYAWPGNVRELGHVLERASILVGDGMEIGVDEVRFGSGRGGREADPLRG